MDSKTTHIVLLVNAVLTVIFSIVYFMSGIGEFLVFAGFFAIFYWIIFLIIQS
jgi:hypothetical protein